MPSTNLKIVGTTGATGAQGFNALITAHTTNVNTAIVGLTAVTGFVPQTATIVSNVYIVDSVASLYEMVANIQYVTLP